MTTPPMTISRQDRDRIYDLLDESRAPAEVADVLYQELARARIVDEDELPGDVVALDSRVRFVNEDDGRTHEVKVVLPRDHQPGETVSVLAPAGAALLGSSAGDRVHWPLPARTLRLRLLDVLRS